MSHEIDLKKYKIRTDLMIESLENTKGINSKTYKEKDINITIVSLNKNGSKLLNKKVGDYITIEFDDVTDSLNRKNVTEITLKYLKKLLKNTNIKDNDTCLIIGLGNDKSTPDSLGPLVIENIIVTNHIYMLNELDNNYRRVYAIKPGVTGETGIETSNYIKALINEVKPNFIITIDALASKSIERVNKTIQMTNTGIAPGSGVGNSRKEISFETVGIPVISIGVPTVVDAVTIVSDTINFMHKQYAFNKKFLNDPISKLVSHNQINYLKKEIEINPKDKENLLGLVGKLTNNEIHSLIDEVLTPIGYNMMITPKEIDFVIEKLGLVISDAINLSLHKIKID